MARERLRWADEGAIELPFTLTVYADLAGTEQGIDELERRPSDYIPGTAVAVEAMTTRLLGDVDRARRALQKRIHALGEPRRDSAEDARMPAIDTLIDVRRVLWELSDEKGFHDGYVIDFVAHDLRAALDGTFQPIQLAYWATRTGGPALRLVCVSIEFEPGSLRSKLKLVGASTAFILTLVVGAAATPPGQDLYERYRVSQELTMIYGTESCLTRAEFEIDGGILLDAIASELSFNGPGLSPEQRLRAICLSQLALDLSGFRVGPIDGIYGPDTERQHRAFAKSKGYDDVRNPAVSRLLAAALHAGARTLVTK